MDQPKALKPYFAELLDNIDRYGWQVTTVMGDQHEGLANLPFGYTVGLWKTFKHPELFISGVPTESASGVLNTAAEMVKEGARFTAGDYSSDLLDGYNAALIDVPLDKFADYGLSVVWFYGEHLALPDPIPALQIVWPSPGPNPAFPWEGGWPPEWRERQVVLGKPPLVKH